MIKLIGIVIILIGFILKLDTIAVVLVAGITTGLVSGLGIVEILDVIGNTFVNTRYMTIFFLTLPVIGILERYGLREQAAILIRKLKKATAGRVLWLYTIIRLFAAAFSLRLGGHVQFIRPLIHPMSKGAMDEEVANNLTPEQEDMLKGHAASAENYGNFFGQNIFVASAGVLLIVGTLKELKIDVAAIDVAKASIPVAVIVAIISFIKFYMMDKALTKGKKGERK